MSPPFVGVEVFGRDSCLSEPSVFPPLLMPPSVEDEGLKAVCLLAEIVDELVLLWLGVLDILVALPEPSIGLTGVALGASAVVPVVGLVSIPLDSEAFAVVPVGFMPLEEVAVLLLCEDDLSAETVVFPAAVLPVFAVVEVPAFDPATFEPAIDEPTAVAADAAFGA